MLTVIARPAKIKTSLNANTRIRQHPIFLTEKKHTYLGARKLLWFRPPNQMVRMLKTKTRQKKKRQSVCHLWRRSFGRRWGGNGLWRCSVGSATLTLSLSLSLSHTHTHPLSLAHTHSFFDSRTQTHTHTHSYTQNTHTHTHTHTLSVSFSHTYTHPRALSLTHAREFPASAG